MLIIHYKLNNKIICLKKSDEIFSTDNISAVTCSKCIKINSKCIKIKSRSKKQKSKIFHLKKESTFYSYCGLLLYNKKIRYFNFTNNIDKTNCIMCMRITENNLDIEFNNYKKELIGTKSEDEVANLFGISKYKLLRYMRTNKISKFKPSV